LKALLIELAHNSLSFIPLLALGGGVHGLELLRVG
jgi:hypothetical protein